MNAPGGSADLVLMNEDSRGQTIRERRTTLGIMSVREFAKATGLSRNAIAAAEGGTASDITYARLENWLDNFEQEIGADDPDEDKTVTFTLSGNHRTAVVAGPVSHLAELEAAAERLLRSMRVDGEAEE